MAKKNATQMGPGPANHLGLPIGSPYTTIPST